MNDEKYKVTSMAERIVEQVNEYCWMVTILVKAPHGKLVLLPTWILSPVDPAIGASTKLILVMNLLTSLLPHDALTSSAKTENSETFNYHEQAWKFQVAAALTQLFVALGKEIATLFSMHHILPKSQGIIIWRLSKAHFV